MERMERSARTNTRMHAHDMHVRVLYSQDLEKFERGEFAGVVGSVTGGEGAGYLDRASVDAHDYCRCVAGRQEGLADVETALDVDLFSLVSDPYRRTGISTTAGGSQARVNHLKRCPPVIGVRLDDGRRGGQVASVGNQDVPPANMFGRFFDSGDVGDVCYMGRDRDGFVLARHFLFGFLEQSVPTT